MKRLLLLSVMAMLTMVSFGRKHVENATIVADTIFYAQNKMNVVSSADASYYRLLMTVGQGMNKQDVFQDYYMDGTLKAEGGYNFVDLGNDNNTVIDGEFTTYYPNGREKWHGQYVNGKRHGYFTMLQNFLRVCRPIQPRAMMLVAEYDWHPIMYIILSSDGRG